MTTSEAFEDNAMIVRSAGLLTAEVEGELMAMSLDRGMFYGLNSVGTRIWALLAEPMTLDTLVSRLIAEFDVEPNACRTDVAALLTEMRDEGLVSATAV